ncbi:hypothetical protein CTEN210_02983 [Chaetoceros tenuissimus]|uniref:Uncharacterized protein n=1 Tax=Chaetoceros tenuissimus TaxID=426638 RepID=A0AAD3CIY3_9STRA|nr:hypothetical protein CTEN210_02983 [Chaetoceros tenuissimus]
MTSLTQEILDLEMQLKCIREDIIGDWKDEKCLKDIMKTVQSTKKQLVDAFGQSLHALAESEPKTSTVESVVKNFPDAMKIENEKKRLPIQACLWYTSNHALKYIPLLAREGFKYNVGGEGKRGGLLTSDPSWDNARLNTLQLAAIMNGDGNLSKDFDEGIVKVLETLKKDGLLKKGDVTEYNLIRESAWKGCHMRFKFLLQLDPESVSGFLLDGKMFMYYLVNNRKLCHFKAILKVTLELYPEQAGYLFQKNLSRQQTAVERAIRKYGEKETMTALHEIISPSKRFPILHHALVHAPKTQTLFMQWFPWAYNLRDHNNRSLIQAILAAGATVLHKNAHVFASMSDEQICEKDPITTLYPFAAIASGEDGDLEKSFYLLRRQPGVLDRSQPRIAEQVTKTDGKKKRKRGGKKKRKRNESN